jgi:hypothetical protein
MQQFGEVWQVLERVVITLGWNRNNGEGEKWVQKIIKKRSSGKTELLFLCYNVLQWVMLLQVFD